MSSNSSSNQSSDEESSVVNSNEGYSEIAGPQELLDISPRGSTSNGHNNNNGTEKKSHAARKAFARKDPELSVKVHQSTRSAEKHKKGAEHIKSGVFGAIDGIITTFSVVSGSVGGSLGTDVILILGFSNLIADGMSMGLGDFISSKAEFDYARAELRRERWEYENYAQGEIEEMVEIYEEKGLSHEDATELVHVLAKNKDNFIDTMMVEELGMLPPDPTESPAKGGLVTFGAFSIFGLVPLLPYVISQIAVGHNGNDNLLFGLACGLVALMLFFLGAITSRFTIHSWYKAGFYMLIVGTVAAISSYFIGWAVDAIVNNLEPKAPPSGECTCCNFTEPAPSLEPIPAPF